MGFTVEQVAEKAGVGLEILNEEVSDRHVLELAKFFSSFEELGPYLGLERRELDDIDEDKRNTPLKRRELVQKWKDKYAFEATYRKFVEALLNCGWNNMAYKVCCYLAKEGIVLVV